jgi:hypothetical protein
MKILKNRSAQILLLFVTGLICGLAGFQAQKRNEVTSSLAATDNKPAKRIILDLSIPVSEPFSLLKVPSSESADSETLRSVLEDVGAYIDEDKSKSEFQKHQLDSRSNFTRAIQILRAPYNLPITRGEAEQKVLTLHSIRFSQWMNSNICLELLSEIVHNFEDANDTVIYNALLWDLTALAKICARINSKELNHFLTDVQSRQARAQIELALSF